VERSRGAPETEFLRYLEQSYRLTPREGWISYYRNTEALSHFAALGPAVQELVREEFRNLVRDFPSAAVESFRDAGEASRKMLLAWVSDLPLDLKRSFAVRLDQADLLVDGPGVEYGHGRALTK
jgi:hypothetical protein